MFLIVALVQFCSPVHIPPIQSWTISQRRFLPKLKVCLLSVSSTNPSAQNSKLENNASDNTSLQLMYKRHNLLFYSQFSCAIARFHFLNISVSFCLAFSMSSEMVLCPILWGINLSHIYAREVRWNFKFDSWYSSKICSCLSKKNRHSLHLLFFKCQL